MLLNIYTKRGLLFLTVLYFVLLMAGCDSPQTSFTERTLVIGSNQTVKIPELSLTITNAGCGRKWITEENKPAFERAYCALTIKHKDSTVIAGQDFQPVYIANVKIQIDKMNLRGVVEDSVPPGGCRVIITRLSDVYR